MLLHIFALVLANGSGRHHAYCWIVLPIAVLGLLGAVWLVLRRRRNGPPGEGGESPRRILAERFARGEIDGDEYRDRLAQLD